MVVLMIGPARSRQLLSSPARIPATLGNNNWFAGGLSVYGIASESAFDAGYTIYAGVDNTETVSRRLLYLSPVKFFGDNNCPENFDVMNSFSIPASSVISCAPYGDSFCRSLRNFCS